MKYPDLPDIWSIGFLNYISFNFLLLTYYSILHFSTSCQRYLHTYYKDSYDHSNMDPLYSVTSCRRHHDTDVFFFLSVRSFMGWRNSGKIFRTWNYKQTWSQILTSNFDQVKTLRTWFIGSKYIRIIYKFYNIFVLKLMKRKKQKNKR